MSSHCLTDAEIISLIEHSNLPCVLVEGKDDNSVYSWLQIGQRAGGVELVVCNGRNTLLAVYDHRDRFVGKKVAFLADRDLWLFTGVPDTYSGIVFTEGYSIENDALSSGAVDRLLSLPEKTELKKLMHELACWFACEVAEHLQGRDPVLDTHVNQLIPLGEHTLDPNYVVCRNYKCNPSPALARQIRSKPRQFVRGKQILQLYVRLLSAPRRQARHNSRAVLEIAVKSRRSRLLGKINDEVVRRLDDGAEESPALRITPSVLSSHGRSGRSRIADNRHPCRH